MRAAICDRVLQSDHRPADSVMLSNAAIISSAALIAHLTYPSRSSLPYSRGSSSSPRSRSCRSSLIAARRLESGRQRQLSVVWRRSA
jgi:hypothetical protein